MSIIKLTSGFTLVPEGVHIFRIDAVDYNAATGKLVVKMVTQDGYTHEERFSLKKSATEVNDKALNAFSFFAHTALNDSTIDEIDHTDLVGKFMECEVQWRDYPKSDGSVGKAANLVDKRPSEGWESVPDPAPVTTSGGIDLAKLFGR